MLFLLSFSSACFFPLPRETQREREKSPSMLLHFLVLWFLAKRGAKFLVFF